MLHGCRAPFPRRECRPCRRNPGPSGTTRPSLTVAGPPSGPRDREPAARRARAVPASRPAGTAVTLDDSRIANPTWVLYGRDWPCRQGPERRGYPHPGARPGAGCCKGISPRHYAGALSCDRCDALTATSLLRPPGGRPDRAAAGRLRPGRAGARQLHRRQLNRAGLRPVPRPPEPGSRWHQHQGSGARRREYRADARPRSRDEASARSTPALAQNTEHRTFRYGPCRCGPPGGRAPGPRGLPRGARDVGGDDVGRVPVQAAAGPVIPHSRPRVCMRGGLLLVAQRHAGIESGGDVSQRVGVTVLPIPARRTVLRTIRPAPPGRSATPGSSTSSSIQAITPPRLFPRLLMHPAKQRRGHLSGSPCSIARGGTVASGTRSPRQRDGGVCGRGEQLPTRRFGRHPPTVLPLPVGQRVSGHHHLAERDGAVAGDRHQRGRFHLDD